MKSFERIPLEYTERNRKKIDDTETANLVINQSMEAIRQRLIGLQKEILSEDKNAKTKPSFANLAYVDFELGSFEDGKITPSELILLNKALDIDSMPDAELDKFYFEVETYKKLVDQYIDKSKKQLRDTLHVKNDSKQNVRDYLINRINGSYLRRERDLPENIEREEYKKAA